ncbi:MAG: hypothetical protein Kow0025_04140 [Thermodesulfovibrionales bacterium]
MEIKGIGINHQHDAPQAQNEALRDASRQAEQAVRDAGGSGKGPEPLKARKAFFAVDENEKVVIRVVDDRGRVVRQIPPEEYLEMSRALEESMKNILDIEV